MASKETRFPGAEIPVSEFESGVRVIGYEDFIQINMGHGGVMIEIDKAKLLVGDIMHFIARSEAQNYYAHYATKAELVALLKEFLPEDAVTCAEPSEAS